MEAAIDEPLADAERKALARCRHAVLGVERPMRLDCGVDLGPFAIAYQTYGTLNPERSNAILICHALTGDQYRRRPAPDHRQGRAGGRRWSGPATCSTPTRYFLICANVLGGCMGTTGPNDDQPGDRRAVGPRAFRSSRSATWCGRRSC